MQDDGLTTRDIVLEVRSQVAALREEMRSRFHSWSNEVWAPLEKRVRDLEEFRRGAEEWQRANERRAEKYIPMLEELVNEENLAANVAAALNEQKTSWLTTRQKLLASLTGVTVLALQIYNSFH